MDDIDLMGCAVGSVHVERWRQVHKEGFTADRDDRYRDGELARAAACYAIGRRIASYREDDRCIYADDLWPFADADWKPGDRRADLVKAGALIIAEIERIDRMTPPSG